MMHWFGNGGYGMGYGSGGFFMLFFWVVIVLLIIYFVKQLVKGQKGQRPEKTPEQILKERYARGEINKEEFDRMKKDLQE
jgi:putative membrane protein